VQNNVITKALEEKQDKLHAGEFISIDGSGEISALAHGKVEKDNQGLVTGGDIYEALKNAGSDKAVSFENYSTMISTLNNLDKSSYQVGKIILIATRDVPDLWVSSVESISLGYPNISDTLIVEDLNSLGSIQVGYFKLSALETQKVDLTEYATKEALGNKLDKLTPTDASQYYPEIYAMTPNKNPYLLGTTVVGSDSPAGGGFLPVYLTQDGNTHLFTGTPKRDFHCSNKKYVDENKGTKLYKHTIEIYDINGESLAYIYFNSYRNNTNSVIYADNENGIYIDAIGISSPIYLMSGGEYTICNAMVETPKDGKYYDCYYFDFAGIGEMDNTEETFVEVNL
jgi:hypothetical protein